MFWLGCLLFIYFSFRADGWITWTEFKGVTRWLLKGPEKVPCCRACEIELPDPMLREPLRYGAFVCLDCADEVEEAAGRLLPEWYTKPLPPRAREVPIQECPYVCAGCGVQCDHWCDKCDGAIVELAEVLEVKTALDKDRSREMTDSEFKRFIVPS
jgi:hypothetical protein